MGPRRSACLAAGVPVHLIGVEFSRERRAVAGFEVEHLAGA